MVVLTFHTRVRVSIGFPDWFFSEFSELRVEPASPPHCLRLRSARIASRTSTVLSRVPMSWFAALFVSSILSKQLFPLLGGHHPAVGFPVHVGVREGAQVLGDIHHRVE